MKPEHGRDPNDRVQQQAPGQHRQTQQPHGQHQQSQQLHGQQRQGHPPQGQQSQGHRPQGQQLQGHHAQSQQLQGQQPQGGHSQGQQPPSGGAGGRPGQSQQGPAGQLPRSPGTGAPQQSSGPHQQQSGGFGQGATPSGGPNPPQAPGSSQMAGGMGAGISPQQRGRQPQQQPGQRLLRPVTVDDIAAEDVETAERDTPIRTAVASMAENDIGSVVVVEDDEPVGVLTDRTIALELEDSPEVAQQSVGDLVSEDVVTVDPSTNIFDVVRMMGDNGIRRIPVVDEDGELQGIVTLDDVIVLLGTELGNVAETIQTQIDRL